MLFLCLLTVLGLALADTEFLNSVASECQIEIPQYFNFTDLPLVKKVGGDCVMFLSDLEEVNAREFCRAWKAEYSEFFLSRSDSATKHILPVCMVRREIQCQCGKPNRGSKIVGGRNVRKNEYPWQVRLSVPGDKAKYKAWCGGSVLTREKILTAAHCTEGQSVQSLTVWTRDHDWTKTDGEESHAVCSKTEHPEYDRKARYDQDIAILHLCQPLMFSEGKFTKYFQSKSD